MTSVAMQEPAAARRGVKNPRVLVGDDQPGVLEALRLLLKSDGYQTVMVDSPQALLRASQAESFDLILMDLNYARDTTSGQEGLDLLTGLAARRNPAPVIVMTAWGNIELAVEAMRRGAGDFIQKPWDNARLLATVRKQVDGAAVRAAAERRARSELEIAHNVQQKLFPQNTKKLPTIDYAGFCAPAGEVSGDYYDFLDLGDSIGFVLADVSGKGVPAALLMANLQACFRSQPEASLRAPGPMLRSVNKLFFESTAPEHYATLFFGVYCDPARTLRYVNCGHVPPMLIRAHGRVERLDPTATVLGAFRAWDCDEREVALQAGDLLALFSDGVTEAGPAPEEEFGEERLLAAIAAGRQNGVEPLVHAVANAAAEFSGGAKADDITVVAVAGR